MLIKPDSWRIMSSVLYEAFVLFVKRLSPVLQGIQRSSRETCSIVEGTDEFYDDFVASRSNSRSTLGVFQQGK